MPIVTPSQAIALLEKNGVVAIPTETVYGLAGKFDSEQAVQSIFSTKQRPFFDPLIVHVADWKQIPLVSSEWGKDLQKFAEAFWPGPLTLILKKTNRVSGLISSGLETVGLRWPQHSLAQQIISSVGPLAAPSANMFGKTSPTTADHVMTEFHGQVAVVDGGPCAVGIESTVLRPQFLDKNLKIEIFRPGGVTGAQLQNWAKINGYTLTLEYVASQSSPGHTPEHYQPNKPMFLVNDPKDLVQLSTSSYSDLVQASGFELCLPEEPYLAARMLYSDLRRASDDNKTKYIYLIAPDHFGSEEWRAIRDRVLRAIKLDFRPKT